MINRTVCHAIWGMLVARTIPGLGVFAFVLEGLSEVLEVLVYLSRGMNQKEIKPPGCKRGRIFISIAERRWLTAVFPGSRSGMVAAEIPPLFAEEFLHDAGA